MKATPLMMHELPSISIVVPNYNGGRTIGRTLESLIDQSYPRLEILVFDGGSSDQSVEVIQRYAPQIAYWESKSDRGQGHAINKGLARCTGEIVNWLCSDDYLLPGALRRIGEAFAADPNIDVLAGKSQVTYEDGRPSWLYGPTPRDLRLIPCFNPVAQPSCFYRRCLLIRDPPIDESFHYAMDFELWNHFISQGARWACVDTVLSVFTNSGENKTETGGKRIFEEVVRVYRRYTRERVPLINWFRWVRHPLVRMRTRLPRKAGLILVRPIELLTGAVLGSIYGIERYRAMYWLNRYSR